MQPKRTLRLRSIVTTSTGLTFATTSFIAAAQVANYLAGDSAWLALLVAGLLVCLSAGCFSELNGLYPSAAGIRLYLRHAFADEFALVASLVYMFVISTVIGAETYALSHVLSYSLPGVPPAYWVVVMLGFAAFINVRGIKLAAGVQDALTFLLVGSLLALATIGLAAAGAQPFHLARVGGSASFFNAVAIGIFLYAAFEWVTPLAEEVSNSRLITRGMFWAVGLLTVVYALLTVAMRHVLGPDISSAVPQILMGKSLFGQWGVIWMTAVSLIASLTTFNAGMITVSRFLYASAREGALPKLFSHINIRYATPDHAVYALFALALVVSLIVLWTKSYLILVNVGAATESLIYAAAGLAVWRLRRTQPHLPRPYRLWAGSAAGIACAVIFFLLACGVFAQAPAAGLYLLGATVLAWAHVRWIVPQLRARREAERKQRSRRPERPRTAP